MSVLKLMFCSELQFLKNNLVVNPLSWLFPSFLRHSTLVQISDNILKRFWKNVAKTLRIQADSAEYFIAQTKNFV